MEEIHGKVDIGHVIRDAVRSDLKKWLVNPMDTEP
jgi:hypothetical protein